MYHEADAGHSPFVNDTNIDASLRECIRAHDAGGAGTDNQYVDVTFLRHGYERGGWSKATKDKKAIRLVVTAISPSEYDEFIMLPAPRIAERQHCCNLISASPS